MTSGTTTIKKKKMAFLSLNTHPVLKVRWPLRFVCSCAPLATQQHKHARNLSAWIQSCGWKVMWVKSQKEVVKRAPIINHALKSKVLHWLLCSTHYKGLQMKMEHKGGHWQVHEEYIVHTMGTYHGMPKGTSRAEAMTNNKIKYILFSYCWVMLVWRHLAISQSVENSIG